MAYSRITLFRGLFDMLKNDFFYEHKNARMRIGYTIYIICINITYNALHE